MSNALSLQDFLPYRCNRLAEQISVSLSRIYVDKFGINVAGWRILVTLAEHGELPARDIVGLTAMDKVRVSRGVATLLEQGLLSRRVCSQDSRATPLRLSAAGKRLYRRIEPEALAWEQSLLAPLSGTDQAALTRILDTLERRLEAMSSAYEAG